MKLLKLKRGVFSHYRNITKGNADTPYHIVQAKLTRNVALAFLAHKGEDGFTLYHYGNLHIQVQDDTIVNLWNHKHSNTWFYKDKKKYKELNDLLGITAYEKGIRPNWWTRLLNRLRLSHLLN
jgi:hypothetical protein